MDDVLCGLFEEVGSAGEPLAKFGRKWHPDFDDCGRTVGSGDKNPAHRNSIARGIRVDYLIRSEGTISIIVNLDVMLAKRKMKLNDLSLAVGVSVPNLSVLKTGKAKAVRFSTLEAICRVLDCQPGDILEFRKDLNSETDDPLSTVDAAG